MMYFISVFIQRIFAFFKNIAWIVVSIISIILLAFFNIRLHQKNQQKAKILTQVKNARKIEEENSKLTTDELIDKL